MNAPGGCSCGRPELYDDCCGAIIGGRRPAVTAEDLMRSRYSAFAHHETAYLLDSWAPETRPMTAGLGDQIWISLTIVDVVRGGPLDQVGEVEFIARYRHGADIGQLTERSTFRRHHGRWVYVDGVVGGR